MNVSNSVSLVTRHLDFETLHHHFGHASNEIMHHVLDNVEDTRKIHLSTQKHVCYSCTLRKMYQCSFSKNPTHSNEPLGLTH